jgi:hypothetical protein
VAHSDDWTSLSNWIREFRERHASARVGKLDRAAMERYRQDRDVLAKALLIAQRLTLKPGQMARQTLRVASALAVELNTGIAVEKTRTSDLGIGGFAVLVARPFSVLQQVRFKLTLADGAVLEGEARVVNVQRKGQPFRVAFSFHNLPPAAADRISLEVFEAALATIPAK